MCQRVSAGGMARAEDAISANIEIVAASCSSVLARSEHRFDRAILRAGTEARSAFGIEEPPPTTANALRHDLAGTRRVLRCVNVFATIALSDVDPLHVANGSRATRRPTTPLTPSL